MTDETLEVKQDAPSEEVQPQEENSDVVSDETAKVDREVYEKVRKDMFTYKAEKKAKDVKVAELEARLAAIESTTDSEDEGEDQGDVRTKAKVEILYLINSDPFVKENLDLIEDKMADNPKMTAQTAIKELKSDFFDKMQKEVSTSEPEKPLKQINPKGSSTTRENIIRDAVKGKNENADPAQIQAYEQQMARLRK